MIYPDQICFQKLPKRPILNAIGKLYLKIKNGHIFFDKEKAFDNFEWPIILDKFVLIWYRILL